MNESDNRSNRWNTFLANDGITRRTMLDSMAAGGLAAAMASLVPGRAFAAPDPEDEVVRIGYIPITDATALLTAHAMGYFEDEGLEAVRPTLIRAGRRWSRPSPRASSTSCTC